MQGRYRTRFAIDEADLDAVLRLRFEIFNLELEEGLASSFESGRDEDPFDRHCHHLIVEDGVDGRVVGTYRMQTNEMADRGNGFYSAGEFDLSRLPREVIEQSVEVGRACITRSHRNRSVLFLLWKGLASYLSWNHKRYLFGCCSLTSQNPEEGRQALRLLETRGQMHTALRVSPLPGLGCDGPGAIGSGEASIDLPILFKTYLRYGAKALGAPAIDREFKTIDFLTLLDVGAMDADLVKLYFPPDAWKPAGASVGARP